jgi:chemotaxis protein MotB
MSEHHSGGSGAKGAVIVIKKVAKSHGGHHGGAWKVAYADFVTAMMALFIVLWLLNSNQEVQQAVGGYFRDPTGKGKELGNGVAGNGENLLLKRTDMGKIKEAIEGALKKLPEFNRSLSKHVQMIVTGEGLRIELLETESGVFFETGSAQPTHGAQKLLAIVAGELGKLQNKLLIEGHTDSRPFAREGSYTNWELSADRANAARRTMGAAGLRPDQVTQVRGYADQHLRTASNPQDPANRRVSILVQNTPAAEPQEPAAVKKAPAAQAHGGGH